ncbi:MAG: transposase [Planctomycetes bacterium]|nr:transposase [Planctomycetota bacterium]
MRAFDAIFESEGVIVKKVGPLAPNMNAYAERWVQSLKHECLNHFVVFGERHLQRLVDEYVAYYQELRPHQAIGNVVLDPNSSSPLAYNDETVDSQDILGGLIKHYYRKAA